MKEPTQDLRMSRKHRARELGALRDSLQAVIDDYAKQGGVTYEEIIGSVSVLLRDLIEDSRALPCGSDDA